MRASAKIIPAALLSISATAAATVAGTAPAEAEEWNWGCPSGYVCIYTLEGFEDSKPEHKYYTYGVHKLYDEWDQHVVFNNQYGGASMSVNTSSDGSRPDEFVKAGFYKYINLTPINSITLYQ